MGRRTRIRGIEVGARCLVSRGEYLLFQYDSKYDYYRFPGGHTEYYESITHCAMREMREELGVEASPKRIVYINENMYMVRNRLRHELVFYYDCSIRGEPVPLEDKSSLQHKEEENSHGTEDNTHCAAPTALVVVGTYYCYRTVRRETVLFDQVRDCQSGFLVARHCFLSWNLHCCCHNMNEIDDHLEA